MKRSVGIMTLHVVTRLSLGMTQLAFSQSALAQDIDGHCVAFCDEGGSGGDSGGWGGESGGNWGSWTPPPPSGPTPEQLAAQQQHDAMMQANDRANRLFESGDYANAVAAYEEALRYKEHPTVRENLRNAQEQLRLQQEAYAQQQERQRKQAETTANIRAGISRLNTMLQTQSTGVNFDGSSGGASSSGGLGFMDATASTGGASTSQGFIDSSVVDLRDAKTLSVDPAKVKGQSPTQQGGLEFMDLRDAAAESPQQSAQTATSTTALIPSKNRAFDVLGAFVLGHPYDREALLQIPPEVVQEYIEKTKGDRRGEDAILRKALMAADQEGRISPLVELEILSRDPKLHKQVEAVRDRVRQQELEAFRRAHQEEWRAWQRETDRLRRQASKERGHELSVQELDRDAKYGPLWTAARDRIVAKTQAKLGAAHERAERELTETAKRLRGQTTLDFDAETRRLRQEYLKLQRLGVYPVSPE